MNPFTETLAARVLLGWIVEPGNRALHELVAAAGPIDALRHVLYGRADKPLTRAATARLSKDSPRRVVDWLMREAERLGVRIVTPESPEWPSALDDLAGISVLHGQTLDRDTMPPQCLWVRGAPALNTAMTKSVSIVGAREDTAYGRDVTAELTHGLVRRGWTIVSGGAYGIDATAHQTALAADGLTAAILACGVDRPYPLLHNAMFDAIAERGLLISEWPPGTMPWKTRFLIRNRVIAAITRGTIVVEAGLRSGSRQTLRRARQLGRGVMAVPGSVQSPSSDGCHEELRRTGEEQVRLVTCVDHVLEEIGALGTDLAPVPAGPSRPLDGLSQVELRLLDTVPKRGGMPTARVAELAGVPLLETMAQLPSLALRGFLQSRSDDEKGTIYTRTT